MSVDALSVHGPALGLGEVRAPVLWGRGRVWVTAAEVTLHERGVEYPQVKTLSPDHPDRLYAMTRVLCGSGFPPAGGVSNTVGRGESRAAVGEEVGVNPLSRRFLQDKWV